MDFEAFDSFEPIKFLRTHSKNKDNADVKTQVWNCAFEPDEDGVKLFYNGSHTFATCGGNSVCFIDCISGSVVAKYYAKDTSISFFSLAWTTIKDRNTRRSVLIAGTSKNSLFVFDSIKKLCALEHKFLPKRNICVNSLIFHQTEKSVLFCGFSNGAIRLCILKMDPSTSTYSIQENNCISNDEEVLDMTYCLTTRLLIVSRSNGLHCFYYPSKQSLINSSVKKSYWFVVSSIHRKSDSDLVDAVEVLKDGLIACKYVLHGCIYICDTKQLRPAIENEDIEFIEIEALHKLTWSNTDNYYMYMGVNNDANVLCCGDDVGSLWLYDLSFIGKYNQDHIPPTAIIPWPQLTDHYNDRKRKLELDVYDIVIAKVAIHSSGNYIVAVTNNNLVCIWGRNSVS